jgi:hypothetical protein
MRRSIAIAAGLGMMISAAAASAETERSSPQVLTLGERAATAAPAPTILRGSAVRPRAAAVETTDQIQIVGGRRIWLVDRETGEVQSCINRQTSTVGVREVVCTTAELGGYSRTFGPNFHP